METAHAAFICAKCQHGEYDADEFRVTGGNFAKLFDVQSKKFTTTSCRRCSYTELYRGDTYTLNNVLDFIAGG